MNRMRKLGLHVFYLGLVAVAAATIPAFAGNGSGQSGNDDGKNVIVANTAAHPVPVAVQGVVKTKAAQDGAWNVGAAQSGPWNVGITGTPSVQVAGGSVGISGTPTVQVAGGTVNVANLPGAAPALVPVQKSVFGTFASGSRFSSGMDLYTVPAGKQLVIQTVTVSSNLSSADEHLMHVLFQATSGDFIPFTINVQPVSEGMFSQTGANIFRTTEAVTAYAGPGTTVTAVATRDGTNVSFLDSVGVGLAGYLVDAS